VRDCINDQSSDVCIYTLYINVFIYRYISHKDAKLRFKWRLHSVSSACRKDTTWSKLKNNRISKPTKNAHLRPTYCIMYRLGSNGSTHIHQIDKLTSLDLATSLMRDSSRMSVRCMCKMLVWCGNNYSGVHQPRGLSASIHMWLYVFERVCALYIRVRYQHTPQCHSSVA
jgi:hypothetical protein